MVELYTALFPPESTHIELTADQAATFASALVSAADGARGSFRPAALQGQSIELGRWLKHVAAHAWQSVGGLAATSEHRAGAVLTLPVVATLLDTTPHWSPLLNADGGLVANAFTPDTPRETTEFLTGLRARLDEALAAAIAAELGGTAARPGP